MPHSATPSTRHTAIATLWLVFFQIIGMLLPLATLPILARALGVTLFGQIMLALTLVQLIATFIDAGFNTESQRLVAIAQTPSERYQALLDNLIARSLCSLPAVVAVVLMGWMLPQISLTFVLAALWLVIGTLLFPQWWFVVQQQGFQMGFVYVLGRACSAAGILLWVHEEHDALLAVQLVAGASALSGLLLFLPWVQGLRTHWSVLDHQHWKNYLRRISHNIFSGFFANLSTSAPLLILGLVAGSVQTGLFAAADRITRAGAHVLSFIEQSLLNLLAQLGARSPDTMAQTRNRLLLGIGLVLLAGAGFGIATAQPILTFLYGEQFAPTLSIFQVLCVWLALYAFRKAVLTFYFSAQGALASVAMHQWSEASVVVIAGLIGAYVMGGQGVAFALCAAELLLFAQLTLSLKRQTKRDTP